MFVLLKKPAKRKSFKPKVRVGCAFCWQWLPDAERVQAYAVGGAWGGRCECGAFYVADETGRLGGQALLDLTAMACEGDGDRALALENGVHYEVKTKPMTDRDPRYERAQGTVGGPTVWMLKLTGPLP